MCLKNEMKMNFFQIKSVEGFSEEHDVQDQSESVHQFISMFFF